MSEDLHTQKKSQPLRYQLIVLLMGSLFAWYTVAIDFVRFIDIEGTPFRIKDCAVPNPVTTPCFWGAVAFVLALYWTIRIRRISDGVRRIKNQKRLVLFLIAGNIFAWINSLRDVVAFYNNQSAPTIGCSGQLVTNPFTTPCFIGSSLFLLSLIVAFVTFMMVSTRRNTGASKTL